MGRDIRIQSLDAIRGIAASIVIIHHLLLTNDAHPDWATYFPFNFINAIAPGCVLVFFALSGCVLFLSVQRPNAATYFAYMTKRFFRIYPPFAFAVLVSAALFELVRPQAVPGVSVWFNQHWTAPPTIAMLLGHFAMTDVPALRQLDTVMWTLVHELRMSVIFPLIALAVIANWRRAVIVTTFVSAACTYVEYHAQLHWMFDPIATLSYLALFTAGAALALHADVVRRELGRCPIWLQAGLWALALRLVTIPVTQFLGLVTSVGALLVIALAFGTPATDRFLSTNRAFNWLGKVSFSLYLMHWPIALACIHLLSGRLPLQAILGLVTLLSLGTAELMNRFVEHPCMAFGRGLALAVSRRPRLPKREAALQPHPQAQPA
jgi:peptidoglycan/LPS O-acetylase OafA/YrhL